ncbi:hypothetical protein ACU81_03645 [Escherichia coli]|nr:hypothetical protein ACU81_03645 [Escherichia coli]
MFCFLADAVVLIENVFYIAKCEINSDLAVIHQLCFFPEKCQQNNEQKYQTTCHHSWSMFFYK